MIGFVFRGLQFLNFEPKFVPFLDEFYQIHHTRSTISNFLSRVDLSCSFPQLSYCNFFVQADIYEQILYVRVYTMFVKPVHLFMMWSCWLPLQTLTPSKSLYFMYYLVCIFYVSMIFFLSFSDPSAKNTCPCYFESISNNPSNTCFHN